jgi:hypothetical protein
MNNNFIERKGKALVHKKYTREPTPYKLLQPKKVTRSTRSEEEKLKTCTTTQSKRDLKIRGF